MEIKKTLLWVVFSVSGILLLNNWQISQGQPPLPFLAQPNNQNSSKEEVVNRGSQMPTPLFALYGMGVSAKGMSKSSLEGHLRNQMFPKVTLVLVKGQKCHTSDQRRPCMAYT